MTYHIDKTYQLADAVKKGYGSLASRLRAQGVPTKQHNVNVTSSPAKKTAAKTASKPAAKKTAAKKATPTKKAAKKTAAKKTATKKS